MSITDHRVLQAHQRLIREVVLLQHAPEPRDVRRRGLWVQQKQRREAVEGKKLPQRRLGVAPQLLHLIVPKHLSEPGEGFSGPVLGSKPCHFINISWRCPSKCRWKWMK